MTSVVAICGMTGSGKSEVSNYFIKKGFERIHMGVTEMALEKFGETSEDIEKQLRLDIRKEHGMGAMAILHREQIQSFLDKGKSVVIDNMYSWSEYKIFLEDYKNKFKSIAIHASPSTRYERLRNREDGRDYKDPEVSKSRDYSEIEHLEKGGPIAMADFHLLNESISIELLQEKIEEIYKKIEKSL